MGAAAKAGWLVAANIGAVEALKDQGVCRWNYVLRLMDQRAKSGVQSYYHKHLVQVKKQPPPSSGGVVGNAILKDADRIVRRRERGLLTGSWIETSPKRSSESVNAFPNGQNVS